MYSQAYCHWQSSSAHAIQLIRILNMFSLTYGTSQLTSCLLLLLSLIEIFFRLQDGFNKEIYKHDVCYIQPLEADSHSKAAWNYRQSPFISFVLVRDRSRLGHKPDYQLGWSSEYVRKSMYACHSVSVACRPAEKRRRRGEIWSIRRLILVVHRRPNRPQGVIQRVENCIV